MIFQSWGKNIVTHSKVLSLDSKNIPNNFKSDDTFYLVYGKGRSYGDVCLNDQNTLIQCTTNSPTETNYTLNLEQKKITCQAGVTLNTLLPELVRHSLFLPVTPGTSHVTLGGCIANDVHGKNHHQSGTFGHFVEDITLLRSSGEIYRCSETEHRDLFHATIGGLGLTGVILTATIKLDSITSPYLLSDAIKFRSFDEYKHINDSSHAAYRFTVAWVDISYFIKTGTLRGIYIRGNHDVEKEEEVTQCYKPFLTLAFDFPSCFSKPLLFDCANFFYYHAHRENKLKSKTHYNKFFYPLDGIGHWNKFYGKNGLYQLQCLIPAENLSPFLSSIRSILKTYKNTSFVTVLKTMGEKKSLGCIAFSRQGITLCMDFAADSWKCNNMMIDLYKVVFEHKGLINPTKDSFMTPQQFEPLWQNRELFYKYRDPKFTSDFAKRVGL